MSDWLPERASLLVIAAMLFVTAVAVILAPRYAAVEFDRYQGVMLYGLGMGHAALAIVLKETRKVLLAVEEAETDV